MDPDQQAILASVQVNKRTSVASGTARGKDFVAAVAAVCFMYLTPKWNDKGELIENTKVAMTAPTDRQVGNIMVPEVTRLFHQAKFLPGRLTGYDIRTDKKEWFLTGFKADEHQHEAWSGFHAVNTMFVVTEASGIAETIYSAIEGNLQGNSRILIVFNPNTSTGYAANSQKEERWHRFRLDSLNAPNVLQKKIVIPAQVDFEWVQDKVNSWCEEINKADFLISEGDFEWEGKCYRPNDTFRVKVRGMFPKVSQDVLVPQEWIELANKRWVEAQAGEIIVPGYSPGKPCDVYRKSNPLRLGVDVAGMGRDSSSLVFRYGNYVDKIEAMKSAGEANHMQLVGLVQNYMDKSDKDWSGSNSQAFVDTIGEGAGVLSRLEELGETDSHSWLKGKVHSCKASHAPIDQNGLPLKDATNHYTFLNMRAYVYWAIRDWLNPDSKNNAMLPPDEELLKELTETKWAFRSDGKIQIEAKEDIRARIGRSPDKGDSLANTFWPIPDIVTGPKKSKAKEYAKMFR